MTKCKKKDKSLKYKKKYNHHQKMSSVVCKTVTINNM